MKAEYISHMGDDLFVANVLYTKTQQRMIEAMERGYHVTECGKIFGPKGILKVKKCGKQKYPTFSTNWGGFVYGIPIHKFAAYCFYKEESFKEGIVVRHLNGDTEDFSKNNIALGSHSENNLDKPKEVRVRAAKLARSSQGISSFSAKLSTEDVLEIKGFYKKLGGRKAANGAVKALCDKFGVSRTAILNVKNGVNYEY